MKVIIASVHFGAGHTAHLQAYQKLAEECGYDTALYLHQDYMKLFNNIQGKIILSEDEFRHFGPDVVWIYNTVTEIIKLIKLAKEMRSKIVYVLHEPYMGLKELMKDGNYLWKQGASCLLNNWICKKADWVVLSSKYASKNCWKYMHNTYRKHVMFPLIFEDEIMQDSERRYFTMASAYDNPKASDEFLNFAVKSANRNNIKFQIVTRTEISEKLNNSVVQQLMKEGRLKVQQGRSLTEDEMNTAYRTSIATWNAYKRSTQSGVLAHSFMQGAPVIATHVGSFDEYVVDGKTGTFINNYSYESILSAFERIEDDIDKMSLNCRKTFLTRFYYKNQKEQFIKIIEGLKN
ncbi:MAG: glycosyltransferase [Clostridiales bacterium]|nr:glycosyltransferase [Clostridiales bacterium]